MRSKADIIIQSTILAAVAVAAYIVAKSDLSDYKLQIGAFFLAVYIAVQFLHKHKIMPGLFELKTLIDATILAFITSLLIFTTGGTQSPVFFLLYFLLFGLVFPLEPVTVFPFSATLAVLLLLISESQDMFTQILQASSLVVIAPIADLFAKTYFQNLPSQKQIKELEEDESRLNSKIDELEAKMEDFSENELKTPLRELGKKLKSMYEDPSLNTKQRQDIVHIWTSLFDIFGKNR